MLYPTENKKIACLQFLLEQILCPTEKSCDTIKIMSNRKRLQKRKMKNKTIFFLLSPHITHGDHLFSIINNHKSPTGIFGLKRTKFEIYPKSLGLKFEKIGDFKYKNCRLQITTGIGVSTGLMLCLPSLECKLNIGIYIFTRKVI